MNWTFVDCLIRRAVALNGLSLVILRCQMLFHTLPKGDYYYEFIVDKFNKNKNFFKSKHLQNYGLKLKKENYHRNALNTVTIKTTVTL